MNCYEWLHNFSLSGMSITADIAYEQPNPDPELPPILVTITGTQEYPDVGPPYTRRGMRCGVGYDSFYARRDSYVGYQRFQVLTEIQATEFFPLVVSSPDEPDMHAGIFEAAFSSFPKFISGLFKPWLPDDPAFVCADGIWRKSTNVTQGLVRILAEDSTLLAVGYFDRIEPGAAITYYRPDEFEASVGAGVINYIIA